MNKLILTLKKPIFWIPFLLVVVLIFWILSGGDGTGIEFEQAVERDVTEEVSGNARVSAEEEIDLSFEVSGVIREVLINEGDFVKSGDPIARLNTEIQSSEVRSARANLKAEEARLEEITSGLTGEDLRTAELKKENARTSFENTKEKFSDTKEVEEKKVENAREDLLTNDLRAKLSGSERESTFSYEPPVISGVFRGLEEGEYRITLYRSQADSGYSFRYKTDLEEDGFGRVSTITPQPLGDLGLKIIFPKNFARDVNVEWVVEIPNKDSSAYPKLRQTYENVKDNKEKTLIDLERGLKEAELSYERAKSEFESAVSGARSEKVKAQEALVERAEASLDLALSNLDKSVLRAPLDGVVYKKHLSVGEAVSPGSPAFSFSSEGVPHLYIYIPEVDIANLSVGDTARARFDAFPREDFEATVAYVSTVATDREGVASFKTLLDFTDYDERIRSGMTADLDIMTSKRSGVVSVPGRAIIQRDGKSYVRMVENGVLEYREVERGLRGSDGWVEILSGLEAGEDVITYADEADLEALRKETE